MFTPRSASTPLLHHHNLLHLLLLSPATLVAAVTLADFTPRAEDLPTGCDTLYTTAIDDCAPADFGSEGCSSGCIDALEALVPRVQRACGDRDVTGQNIIVAFLAGTGPSSLCPGIVDSGEGETEAVTSSGVESATSSGDDSMVTSTAVEESLTATVTTTTTSSSSSSSSTATTTTTTTAAPTTIASESTASATTSPSSEVSSSIETTSPTPTSSATDTSPTYHLLPGGGGSPFDVPNTTPSSLATALTLTFATASLSAAVILGSLLR